MRDWLKRTFGGGKASGRSGLSKTDEEHLRADLGRLDGVSEGLGQRVLDYIATGGGADVLDVLPGASSPSGALSAPSATDASTARLKFFRDTAIDDPAVFLRLGRVLAAAAQGTGRYPAMVAGDAWLWAFAEEATRGMPPHFNRKQPFPMTLVVEMLRLSGLDEGLPLRGLLLDQAGTARAAWQFQAFAGYPEYAISHPEVFREAFAHPDRTVWEQALDLIRRQRLPESKLQDDLLALFRRVVGAGPAQDQALALAHLTGYSLPLDTLVAPLVEAAVSGTKEVSQLAASLLARAGPEAFAAVAHALEDGAAATRARAAKVLWGLDASRAAEVVRRRLEVEETASVRQVLEEILAYEDAKPGSVDDASVGIEPRSPQAPLCRRSLSLFESALRSLLAAVSRQSRNPSFRERDIPVCIEQLQTLVVTGTARPQRLQAMGGYLELFDEFLAQDDVEYIHLVRLMLLLGIVKTEPQDRYRYFWGLDRAIRQYVSGHGGRLDACALAAAFQGVGIDDDIFGRSVLSHWSGLPFEMDELLPYFRARMDLLADGLGFGPGASQDYDRETRRRNAYEILAAFPEIPAQLIPGLWAAALGPAKTARALAQPLLAFDDDRVARIAEALSDGKADIRRAAAEWLAQLGDASVVPQLQQRLKKEKQEGVRVALLDALEALGASLDAYLAPPALAAEAERGLKKAIHKDLAWFPFDTLPTVRWAGSREPVDPRILRWWVVQAFQLKRPEPGGLLVRYARLLIAEDREALGQYVLDAWVAQDTAPQLTGDAAEQAAQRLVAQWRQWPAWRRDHSDEQLLEIARRQLRQPGGSAIASKGVLAIAGAAGGAGAVEVIGRYLKEWYGGRAAQCKALLGSLAYVDHPLAIQLLLATATRFRTKGIRQEAEQLVQELAERRGWTIDELADRTIPSAGLEEDGRATLPLGARALTMRLNEEMELRLEDEDGKTLKSMPAARKSDDPELHAAAKKQFSAARKELKAVVKAQSQRLYEAMCAQRVWAWEDWDAYLHRHPIVGRLATSLVWRLDQAGGPRFFRPLGDGTLTDETDAEVAASPGATVTVAHASQMSPELRAAWARHLADYDVVPLFEQLDGETYTLPEDQRTATRIEDHQGFVVNSFRLRSIATKAGYTRGEAQDGGWFLWYSKNLPGIGLEAQIEFSGSPLPEEDREVALRALSFHRAGPRGGTVQVPLGKVPAILLTECMKTMRRIADAGSGHDPDWEKRVAY